MNHKGVNRPNFQPCSNEMSGEWKGENPPETLTDNYFKCPSDICSIKDGGNFTDYKLSNSNLLSEVTLSSYQFQHEVLPQVTQQLYYNSSEKLTIKKCCIVNNSELLKQFVEKKNEFEINGYTKTELSEMYGFICAVGPKKENFISETIKHGVHVGNTETSLIGNPLMGVHLSRYFDVLPVVTVDSSPWFGQIIMLKFLKGRVKTVPLNTSGSPPEPTPNYDCHVIQPVDEGNKDMADKQIQYQNQIYLYEYNEDGGIVEYPRQVIPYAVLDVIYKPKPLNNTLNSPLGKKFNHRSDSNKVKSTKEEYIVWNGKLSLKGSYACNVTMMSSAGYFKPVRLGGNINICNRSEIVRAEEKYFNKLNELNKCQETFWRRRYINITELKPKPGSEEHFKKITKYLLEKNCLAIVKPDSNTVLFLIPSCSLTAKLGLSSTECDQYRMFYCLFLSKQSAFLNSPRGSCFYKHFSPEVASAKLNFPKLYSDVSSEDNSTDIESVGTDLDSPRLDPPVSGITTVTHIKDFLNKRINKEQNKYTISDVSKNKEVPLIANIYTDNNSYQKNSPPLVVCKKHVVSLSSPSDTVQVTKSTDVHANEDTFVGRKVINCSFDDVANSEKQFKTQKLNPTFMEDVSEDDCLLEIANQVSERCSQIDNLDDGAGNNPCQLAFEAVTKVSRNNSNSLTLPSYIHKDDPSRLSIKQSSKDSAEGTTMDTSVDDLISLHTAPHCDDKLQMKPLHEYANQTKMFLQSNQICKNIGLNNRHNINLHQELCNSDFCRKKSQEDVEVVASGDNTQSKNDCDTSNTPICVNHQRASPDLNFLSSSEILNVCKNSPRPDPISQTDSASGAGLNTSTDVAKPLQKSIPEEDLDIIYALPDKFIPRYSSDEESFNTECNKGAHELSNNFPPFKDSTSTGFLDDDLNPQSDSVASLTLEEDLTCEHELKQEKCVNKATGENESWKSRSKEDDICLKEDRCISSLTVLHVGNEIKNSILSEALQPKKEIDFHNLYVAKKKTVLSPPLTKIKVTQDQQTVDSGSSSNYEVSKLKTDKTVVDPQPYGIESDVDNGESSALSDFQNFIDNSDYQVVDEVYSSDETEIYEPDEPAAAEVQNDQIKTDQKTVSLAKQTRPSKDRNIYSFMNKSLDETKLVSQPVVNLTRCDSPNSPYNVKKLFPSKFIDIKPFNELFSESIRKIKLAKSSNKLKLSKKFDNDDQSFLSKLETVCGDDSDGNTSTSISHQSAGTSSKSTHRSRHSHSKSKDKEQLGFDTGTSHTDLTKHDRKSSKDVRNSSKKSSSEQTALGHHVHHHHKKSKKHSKTKSDTVSEKTSRGTSSHRSKHKKSKSNTVKQLESVDVAKKSKRDSHSRSRPDDIATYKSDLRKSKESKKEKKGIQLIISPSKSPTDHKTTEKVKGKALNTNFTIPKKKGKILQEDNSSLHISSVEKASIVDLKFAKGKKAKDKKVKTKLLTSILKQEGLDSKKTSKKDFECQKMSNVEHVKDIGEKVKQNLAEQLKGSNSIVEKFLLISTTDFPQSKIEQPAELVSKSGTSKDNKKGRQFHPYQTSKVVPMKKQWASFDLPVSDLKALMQDLTTYSYLSDNRSKNHGAVKGDRHKSRHERRFSNYVFERSEVPADDEEVKCDYDADDFIDYEERKKQADLVDQPLDEEDKLRYHKDDFMFEEELRLYSGHSSHLQTAITDQILQEESTANIEIMASPTNSVKSLPKYTINAEDDLMDLESDDELVTHSGSTSDKDTAKSDEIPETSVTSAVCDHNFLCKDTLKLNTGTGMEGMKPNITLNPTLKKSNTNLDSIVASEQSEFEFDSQKGEKIPMIHLSPNKFDPNTLQESVVLSKVLKTAQPLCTDHESNNNDQIFTKTEGVPVPCKTDASTVTTKKKYSPIKFDLKTSPKALKAKKISVQIGHALETIPHIPSEILLKPASLMNPNLIQVPLGTNIPHPSVAFNEKPKVDDFNNKTPDNSDKSTNFSLDQNFPKLATFLKVDQDLMSMVSKTIFNSAGSSDENEKEISTSKVNIKTSPRVVTEKDSEMNSKTEVIKDSNDEPIQTPFLAKKESPDLSIRTEVIDDLESMRNLLNCDLTPSHSKGYPKDFQMQTISYDSGVRQKTVPFHDKFDQINQIIPKPVFSAISHDIIIKPISNNLKTATSQFQSALPSHFGSTELGCFSKPSNFQFGFKESNIAILDTSTQMDGNFSSDSSTPVKDEMFTSGLEFDTPVKDEISRINKSIQPINVPSKIVTQLPSGVTKHESEMSDLKSGPCLDPNSNEAQTKAHHTSEVHEVMMNMWKKITSRPDPRKISPRKVQSCFSNNVKSAEETDSDAKQSRLKLHDPRKASPRKIQDPSEDDVQKSKRNTDVEMKTKPKISPSCFDFSIHTNTDKIQQSSEKTTNIVQKLLPTSTKKGTVKKVRHISGVHPKCKDYWQFTVELITFVNLHIKHIADPALKDYVIEMKRYFKDPRMEMEKGLKPRNLCPNTGLVVKPRSRGILGKKCQNSPNPTRTLPLDSVKDPSEKIVSTLQNEVQKINSQADKHQKSKPLQMESEHLPLSSSEKKKGIRKPLSLITSNDKQVTTSKVQCTKEADVQDPKPKCTKFLSFDEKSKSSIPSGTKRKAGNDDHQTSKISKQEVALNNRDKSLKEELLKYALDSKSVPTSKSEKIVLPAFKPVRHQANNTFVQTSLTSRFNESDTTLSGNSRNLNKVDDVTTSSKDICDDSVVKEPDIKSGTSAGHGELYPDSQLISPCVDVSPQLSSLLLVPQRKDSFLSTGKDETQSTIDKHSSAETHPKNSVIPDAKTASLYGTPNSSSIIPHLTPITESLEGTSNKISSDGEKNTNNSSEITTSQTKNEILCGNGIEESELVSSDESVIFVKEMKHQSSKKTMRKRHILDEWENKELSLVDTISDIHNETHKMKVSKNRFNVDGELLSKKSRNIENIFELKKNKMTDKMNDILKSCDQHSSAISELKENLTPPQSLSEFDQKTTLKSDEIITRSDPGNPRHLLNCDTHETNSMVKDQKAVCREMAEDRNLVVGLISLPNEQANHDESKMELQPLSCSTDNRMHQLSSKTNKNIQSIEGKSLFNEEKMKSIERYSEYRELPSLFSQKQSDSHGENILPCEPVDQLGTLSPGRFSCPISQRLSPVCDMSFSGHEIQPQLGLQHPSVNLHPRIEKPNVLNVNNNIFIRNETPMFNNYNFNFGPVHHHNYLLHQVNPSFKGQMYDQQSFSPVPHRNIHINPAMIMPRGSHPNPNLVLMPQGTRPDHFITQPSLASTPNSSRSVSPTSPGFINYSHRLVSDRDPMLSDSVQHMAPNYSHKMLEPKRPVVVPDSMMSQNQGFYFRDLRNSSLEVVLKNREVISVPQDLQKKNTVSIPPLNSESLYLKESMKKKLCELNEKTHNKLSDVVHEASTSVSYGDTSNITPVISASQENYRPLFPKSFSSVNCVIMLEDNFILHRSLEILEALFLQLSHSIQGWKVFIHASVISIIEKRSKHDIFDTITVEAMQRFALVEKYKLRGLIVLVNTCRCNPSLSLLEEKAVCLKQIQSVLYPQSIQTVLITDFVNNLQQMNNGIIISSLDPFYKRFCSR